METRREVNGSARLVLGAATAADLMAPDPVSLQADATLGEAIDLLVGKGISAAPVIDDAGRPVGVLSRSDLLVHERARGPARVPDDPGLPGHAGAVRVRDLMTPAVFSVPPEAPARRVIDDLVGLQVHRLFVIDHDGVLVGVISALDVLQRLRPEG
jgi:CBS domain-containing protein